MDSKGQLASFLVARRAQVQPEDVGLPRDPGRRVEGLRRPEVAELAGISVDYYLRLEQGRDRQPSTQVITALARALKLDANGVEYLHRIAADSRPAARSVTLPSEVTQFLNQWEHAPAYVSEAHHDVVAVNAAARLLAPTTLIVGRNILMDVFEWDVPAGGEAHWEETARRLVAALRFDANPHSERLQEIVGTLSVSSRAFRRMWAEHDARPQTTGVGAHRIDGNGWVELHWLTFDVPGVPGHHLTTFYGDPGSEGEAALARLVERARAMTAQESNGSSARNSDNDARPASD